MITRPRAIACLTAALLAAPLVAGASGLLHLRAEGYASVANPEATPLPADGWLALVCANGACWLAPARAWIDREPVETHEGTVDGEVLRGDAPPGTVALLRGIAGLRAGAVATEYLNPHFPDVAQAKANEAGVPAEPEPLTWTAAGTTRRLSLAIDEPEPEDCFFGRCAGRWTLEGDGATVEIARADGDPIHGREGMLAPADALVWAGDLDGDGRLDLLLRPQPRPDYLELRLLLGRDRPAHGEWPAAAQFYWWDPANPGC